MTYLYLSAIREEEMRIGTVLLILYQFGSQLVDRNKSIPDPTALVQTNSQYSKRVLPGKVEERWKVKAALFWTPSLTAVVAELPSWKALTGPVGPNATTTTVQLG